MKKGFTLLEILVVIGIIALLLGTGITSYSEVQKKSRDTRRKADLKQIQNALEQYYTVCGNVYPTPGAGNTIAAPIACSSPAATFMSTPPVDPKSGGGYTMTGASASYNLTTVLESVGSGGSGVYTIPSLQ